MSNDWPDPEADDVEAALKLAATLDDIKDPSNREHAMRVLRRAVLRLRSQVAALLGEHSGACDDMAQCTRCWERDQIEEAAQLRSVVAAVRALPDRMDKVARGLNIEGEAAMQEMADELRAALTHDLEAKP